MPFVHLQVQSAYSLLSSAAKVETLVEKASNIGHKALALTDENVMYGAIAFYKECRKRGIKPIIGMTASVLSEEEDTAYPVVLLAKNNKGYQNLLKISSAIQTKSKDGIPRRWLSQYCEGLIGISPGLKGDIEQNLKNGNYEEALKKANSYKQIFEQESFYLSVQNHGLQENTIINNMLFKMGDELKVPLVATNHVQYIDQTDSFAHECLLAIKNGAKLSDDDRDILPSKEYYLKSPSQMTELFSESPEVLENTLRIARLCNVDFELGQFALPKYPVPGDESAEDYLSRICLKGLQDRYQNPTDDQYERLQYELQVIKKMNFSDYFLIVWDFMKYAHENGIVTGPGRGSAAGSLVAYVLYITNVDPLEHQLLFERFLNPERISMPDIDIDFPDNRRDEMIEYVSKKYGRLHVAQIITFGTLAARAALRDVGRVMGISPKEADFLAKQVPSKLGITLQQAYEESQGLREYIQNIEIGRKIFDTAKKIEGLPRHTSTHAAGVVISERPLTDLIAIQEGHNNVYLTQFPMDILEEIGLLKMDFLGLRNLTLIDNILSMIKRGTGKTIELSNIPLDDQKTFNLLSKGDTTGVFQLESSGMRSVLIRLQPNTLEDIVAVNALYRPGPMDNIPSYIARKHKKEEIQYPHPDLIPILQMTNGVIVYQEQIMQIASKMAGFSLGEADLLRRAVSKKKKEVLDKERQHFVQGSISKGYTETTANEIYDLIVRFANYGFNRSHAVAYSMIAYQLAYLKANYPLYFMAALLTSVIGNDDKLGQYIRESKQKGIRILSPSINKSHYPFIVENNSIRFSLAGIKGVGVAALKEISETRKSKLFSDLFDFCVRTSMKSINRRTLEALICSGAFDEFGEHRATLLATLDVALEHAELVRPKNDENQFEMFFEDDFGLKPKYVEVEPFKEMEKLRFEKEALGFYLSSHPITAYSTFLKKNGAVAISDAPLYLHQNVVIGGFITKERTIRTKKGEVMAFLTIGDETGELDGVAFPRTYTQSAKLLKNEALLLIKGKIENRNNQIQLIINQAEAFPNKEDLPEDEKKLFVRMEKRHQTDQVFIDLKELLKEYPGEIPVVLYYQESQKTIQLQQELWVSPNPKFLKEMKNLMGQENVVFQ
ncbi:DNA polymerase III subunit alpha [Bacillus sp. REN16]|uniref:DNA polymerase III subunit alpha n=1 Tax=Bacillus sp. REN16 TaxID=2887296 RepID=UPI001E455577|nr:DNA polymerase III subunit alpha [Bacillus sp. REN16]MCC3356445.1 DNA polymerase III subunit alpha [Bacillus sp. REN16]